MSKSSFSPIFWPQPSCQNGTFFKISQDRRVGIKYCLHIDIVQLLSYIWVQKNMSGYNVWFWVKAVKRLFLGTHLTFYCLRLQASAYTGTHWRACPILVPAYFTVQSAVLSASDYFQPQFNFSWYSPVSPPSSFIFILQCFYSKKR